MTADELLNLWLGRDHRYAERKAMSRPSSLTPEEESSIIAYRRSEIARLLRGPKEQAKALVRLSAWRPPLVT